MPTTEVVVHRVVLEWYEIHQAATAGVLRRIESMKKGMNDEHGFGGARQDDVWTREIEGAAGEVAFAKFSSRYWAGAVNTFKSGGDVGKIQVRTCCYTQKNLLVRPRDGDGDYFVLVVGKCPTFEIVGWMKGADAKRPEWSKAINGGPPVFVVPREALMPFVGAKAPKSIEAS